MQHTFALQGFNIDSYSTDLACWASNIPSERFRDEVP